MAGKTFPGIGDPEDDSQPIDTADAADTGRTPSSQFYSGPTVVDDAKVEEGLKKLRSLDIPLTGIAGTIDSAADIIESGGHQMPGQVRPLVNDGGRGTFIGHSVADVLPPPPEPEKPYDDRMRGTLYGHMLHLPELNLPAPEEPSSRELTIVDQSAPTSHAVAVYQPELARRAAAGIPHEAEAFPRSDRYRSIPVEIESGSKNKLLIRIGIAAAAIVAIVGAAIIYLHNNAEEPEMPVHRAAPPAAAPAPVPAPAVEPPTAPARAATPAPGGVAPGDRPPAETAPRPPAEAVRPSPDRTRPLPARPERHGSSAVRGGDAPPRSRAPRHPAVEEDPDGTLAPSIE